MLLCLIFTQHTFVGQPGLSRALAVELLDKVSNPDNHAPYSEGDEDDLEVRAGDRRRLGEVLRFLTCILFISVIHLMLTLQTRYHRIQLGLDQYVDQANSEFSGILSQPPKRQGYWYEPLHPIEGLFSNLHLNLVKMGEATKINNVNSVYMLT